MRPVKYFEADNHEHPRDLIEECMRIVAEEDCVVYLQWWAFRRKYSMRVAPGMTFEECERQIPKVYGL